MTGVRGTGNSHCGRWVEADMDKHGVRRLVCTLPRYHGGGYHEHRNTGWRWRLPLVGLAGVLVQARRYPPVIEREWWCAGWIDDESRHCRKTFVGTEDAARVKGWRIEANRYGKGDQLCPLCGRPDPETLKLIRDLERSVQR